MKTTRELRINDDGMIKQFWRIYDDAFRKLRTLAPCRQHLFEGEFIEKMHDARIIKFVLWDDRGAAVGLALVATELAAIPWISPEFYAALFPDYYQRRTIYYFGALLVAETAQRQHYAVALLSELGAFVFAHEGIACFDCADATNGFLPELIRVAAEARGFVECEALGKQHYYAYVTRGLKPDHETLGAADEIRPARGADS
jgi:hypothetical protein